MNKFKKIETGIDGLFVLQPTVYEDNRGYFMETYSKKDFEEIGITAEFVQDNQSKSTKGVLRGLHFQINHPQAKLVRVIKGTVYDVAVDLRTNSKTYGKYSGVFLSEDNKNQFFIPKDFAHGFLVLSDEAEISYKCDDFFFSNDEGGIKFNDKTLNINWPFDKIGGIENVLLSEKDKNWRNLN